MEKLSAKSLVSVGCLTIFGALTYRRIARGRAASAPLRTARMLTIGAPAAALFGEWPLLLPRVMEPFAVVTARDERRTRWEFRKPLGKRAFETEIVESQPDRYLRWATSDGAAFGGSIALRAAPARRGTEVELGITSGLPGRVVGPALVAVLRRFKSLVETGELPTLERNPSGRSATQKA